MQQNYCARGLSTTGRLAAGSARSWSWNQLCRVVFGFLIPVVFAAYTGSAQAAPAAHFTLRLGALESDAVLSMGDPLDDTLELEVWVEVTDPPDAGTMMTSFAFFLNANQSNVVSFAGDFTPAPAFTGWNPLNSGLDNIPDTGDFDRAYFTFLTPTSEGIGAPTRLGTFTLAAMDVGSVGFAFNVQAPQRLWSIGIDTPEILQGPQVTGSIDPEVETIRVVSAPVIRSADADGDCDVDLQDYCWMQRCVPPEGQNLSTNGCELLDLNADTQIDGVDANLLVEQITGAMPLPGDLDVDGDIDLADFTRFQVCLLDFNAPGLEQFCAWADVNRDSVLSDDDYTKLNAWFTGPQ